MEKPIALVTGASEGIGRAFVERLIAEGWVVTAVARNEARLRELQQRYSADCEILPADLSDPLGVELVVKALQTKHYNLLINNAGSGTYGAFHEVELNKLQEMTRLNCDALISLSYAFLNRAKNGDALINVSSVLAFLPMPHSALYSASKALVTTLSETLWHEQKDRGVYVMGLCPGVTETQFRVRAGGKKEQAPKGLTQSPEQVVEVAIRALKSRSSPTVISGPKNFLMAALSRFMPRKTTVAVMGSVRPATK